MDLIKAGTVFQGRYELVSRLGEGGFGQVYRARQRGTGQEVAVKVLRARSMEEETHVARFQRELKLCAGLHHPNIVRLIDSGRAEPDLLYTVFEYVPGRTLGEVLAEQGALSPGEAAHLMLQVLDALGCAHKQGIIHRDLKPQNIMVTATGVRRNALVLDFGLGTLTPEGQEDLTPITRTREALGTPAYAAPEQLRGEPVTERADLYAWGLIFLECLTGHRMVEGATLHQVFLKQTGPEPVAIPPWLGEHRLGRLLRKVTLKDAALREATAESVLGELEACAAEGWPVAQGRSLAYSLVSSPAANLDVPRIEGERRQLTALCCSLHLHPEPGAVTDEEDQDRLLWSLHTACVEAARRHDAYVGSLLGERMMFYFGYPRAREDDARRAARAALELTAELERRGAELEREHKGRLELRAGLHTGFVISQEPRARGLGHLPALVGSTPSLAVQLAEQARPGTVLASEASSRLLRGYFAFEPQKAAPGEGSQGGALFRLLHEYRALATLQPESRATQSLHGRRQELDLLLQRWWQVVTGTGQSLLQSGDPGIGKSRLVQELIRRVRGTPHIVLECRCVPEGRNSALHPMVDLLERLLGADRDWTAGQTGSALEALLSRHGFKLAEAMPLLLGLLSVKESSERYPPLDVTPQRAKELTFNVLVDLFFELARQQPLLLLVEDLQWADPTTLELLGQLIADVATAPIFLVLTARPGFSVPWTTSHHLRLSKLDRQGVEQMVSELSQGKPLAREVVEQLIDRADGVPLFVEELTQAVVDPLPSRGDTPSRATPGLITIPSTLRDSLMARLDRLGPAREVAQLASALGREFSYEVLEAISQRGEQQLQQDLRVLVEADLVYRRRGVRNPSYFFKHALIRDTAYESMLKEARRQMHARIAATLEARFPQLAEARPELLAQHHAAADQKRQALGYAQKATLAALTRSANHEAAAYATEALSWLDAVEDPRERARLELGLNSLLTPALMIIHGWADERIRQRVEHSQRLIDFLGDSPETVPNLWALLIFHHTRGNRAQARALAERFMSVAEQSGDTGLMPSALAILGHCQFAEGHLLAARALFQRALASEEEAGHAKRAVLFGLEARAWAEVTLGFVQWLLGHSEEAEAHSRAGLARAERLKHPGTLGVAYLYRLLVLRQRGEREQLLEVAGAGLEVVRRYGLMGQTVLCQMLQSWVARDATRLREALAFQDRTGVAMGKTYYTGLLAELELEAGRPNAALKLIEGLISWGRDTGELYMMSDLLRLKGLCLRARRDFPAAEASLREAIDVARAQAAKMLELKAASALGELLMVQGQAARAREVLMPLLRSFGDVPEGPAIAEARALLATAA